MRQADEHAALQSEGQQWGGWRYEEDENGRWLAYPCFPPASLGAIGGLTYDIDLDSGCKTQEEIDDWVHHISEKPWATDGVMVGLMQALVALPISTAV